MNNTSLLAHSMAQALALVLQQRMVQTADDVRVYVRMDPTSPNRYIVQATIDVVSPVNAAVV